MARIRTIKPDFPQSETMGRCSRDARLCFIMLWTLADDAGRLRGNSRMLASLLFPYDSDAGHKIDGWLTELAHEHCIERYQYNSDHYIQICNWLKHQKIDKPSQSKIPAPSQDSRVFAESSRTFVVGMEGKGEERKGIPPTPQRGEWDDFEHAEKHEVEVAEKRRDTEGEPDFTAGFLRFWATWPSHQRKQGKSKCARHWKRKGLENITEEVISALKRSKAAEFSKDGGKFIPFPMTWLNRTPWETDASEMEDLSSSFGLCDPDNFPGRIPTPEEEIILFGKVIPA